ncbi:MAG: hypothetical protein KZQ75_12445 [Candidatus Thiodiazotropha sp. (ex Myrtea spinifera)]|nr:hypothetical protein [Candidatus Thiodiazotropha sp. (ex Myrtea spinifera)]MCU7830245.1 hypothetical protein [Candidatus Thiodiazotropha sp. (ex Myrtea sp. 'scaly one' KF741663)]
MRNKQIEHCIEVLCQKGCQSVRDDIRLLEQGVVLPELSVLDDLARLKVLKELRAIMAVYGDSCPVSVSSQILRGKRGHGGNS